MSAIVAIVGNRPLRVAAVVALACAAPRVLAQTCSLVQVRDVVFTGYSPFGTGALATATIRYRCPRRATAAWIGILGARTLTSGASGLTFELHADALGSVVWPSAPPLPVPVTNNGTVRVYGFLPPQDAAAGSYAATLDIAIYTDAIGTPTDGGRLAVSAVVPGSCVIDAGTLAFGSYDPAATTAHDAAGALSVTCTGGTAYTVGLGAGSFAAGATRQMALGPYRLQYELYADPGRTTPWSSTATVGGIAPDAARIVLPVYGRIPASQLVGAGDYVDTVQATVSF